MLKCRSMVNSSSKMVPKHYGCVGNDLFYILEAQRVAIVKAIIMLAV